MADLDDFASGADLCAACRPLLAAGLPSLQVRARGRTAEAIVRAATALRLEAERAGCFFVVNADVDAARYLGADGVQLPARGPSLDDARRRAPKLEFGVSCHDEEELARARGADWTLLSPVFPTASKPGATTLGEPGLSALLRVAPAPGYALGGVTWKNAAAVLDAGAAGVAAIRGLRGDDGLRLLRTVEEWAARA